MAQKSIDKAHTDNLIVAIIGVLSVVFAIVLSILLIQLQIATDKYPHSIVERFFKYEWINLIPILISILVAILILYLSPNIGWILLPLLFICLAFLIHLYLQLFENIGIKEPIKKLEKELKDADENTDQLKIISEIEEIFGKALSDRNEGICLECISALMRAGTDAVRKFAAGRSDDSTIYSILYSLREFVEKAGEDNVKKVSSKALSAIGKIGRYCAEKDLEMCVVEIDLIFYILGKNSTKWNFDVLHDILRYQYLMILGGKREDKYSEELGRTLSKMLDIFEIGLKEGVEGYNSLLAAILSYFSGTEDNVKEPYPDLITEININLISLGALIIKYRGNISDPEKDLSAIKKQIKPFFKESVDDPKISEIDQDYCDNIFNRRFDDARDRYPDLKGEITKFEEYRKGNYKLKKDS